MQTTVKECGIKDRWTIMKQPTFDWEADDKYSELKNLIQEVNNKFESYNMPQTERVAIIKNG